MLTKRDLLKHRMLSLARDGCRTLRWAAAPTVDQLQLFVPAAPGGGWDQTARYDGEVLKTESHRQREDHQVGGRRGGGLRNS